MNVVLRGIAAIVLGWLVGGVVNMALVNLGPSVIPLPEGADVSTMAKLEESMPLFEARHFLFPFLGHALGTLVGAFIAAKIALARKARFALAIGLIFLLGGIAVVVMLPAPLWFEVTDLVLAYIPMALVGARLAGAPAGA